MDLPEIIENMGEVKNTMKIAPETSTESSNINDKREKLISATLGGGKYIERKITVDILNNMNDEQIEKEFEKYERKLGAVMVTTLGKSILELYTTFVSYFLPINQENQKNLFNDLNKDPFVDNALNKTCCELYYKYGMFFAPLTTFLSTIKYCNFSSDSKNTINNDENSTNKNGSERGNTSEAVARDNDFSTEGNTRALVEGINTRIEGNNSDI